jgi:hypothetical protein
MTPGRRARQTSHFRAAARGRDERLTQPEGHTMLRKFVTCRYLILATVLLVLSFALPGCLAPVNPNSDPVAVNAERSLKLADTTVDTFLKLEKANYELIAKSAPGVVSFANTVRATYPQLSKDYEDAIKAYEAVPSSSNEQKMNAAIAAVNQLLIDVRAHTATIHEKGGK